MKLKVFLVVLVLQVIPALSQDDNRCRKHVDIGFVLDSSKSMSTRDYEKQKQFVKALAATFTLSPRDTQAAAIIYSDDAAIAARFGQYPYIEYFERAVDNFYYMGKRTRIDKALKLASEELFTERSGARADKEDILVILTDGQQTSDPDAVPLKEAARPLHQAHIRVFAIGVGHHYQRSELEDLVERDSDVYEADNFDELLKLVKRIARGTCAPAPVIVPKCRYRADIGFIMDASNSIGVEDFQKERDFVSSLAAAFTFGSQGTHAGVITYSDEALLVIPLGTHTTDESFREAVDQVPFTLGRTRIDKALRLANTDIFSARGGIRPELPKLLVILTDGRQTPDPDAIGLKEASRPLHDKRVDVLAVGVGSTVDVNELKLMVRDDDHVFLAKDFDDLLRKAYEISEKTCEDVEKQVGPIVVLDGRWSPWKEWDTCVPECGGGRQTRVRYCNNPPPGRGGRPCEGSDRESRVCNQQPCEGQVKCTARADIGFVMDASTSIGKRDFQKERDFVKGVAGSFVFAPDQAIAGVITYSTNASIDIPLGQHMSAEHFKAAIDQIPYEGGQTRIDKALNLAYNDLFGRSRPGFPKVMIILTDGVQTTDPDAIALDVAVKPLHQSGVRVFAVGVGGHTRMSELRLLVQRGDDVFAAKDFDDLLKKTYQIAQRTCPAINGVWSFWGQWDKCTRTCGGGRQSRLRACNNPPPENGGHPCPGSSRETRYCNEQSCAIDGNWGRWSRWDRCDQTCGGGRQLRKRDCDNPPPRYGGRQCHGRDIESRSCNEQSCAVHGGWSSWGAYGICIPECGGGKETRLRTCDSPRPRYGGQQCPGSSSDTRICNKQACPVKCTATADFGFVMDASTSIGKRDFQKERDFVKALAGSYTFAPDQAIAGVITYSTNATVNIRLRQYMSVDQFKAAIDQIPYTEGQTRIDRALKLAHNDLFGRRGGSRPGFPKVMIILTDGVQTTDPDAIALDVAVKPLHQSGVRVFAVGVGGHTRMSELRLLVQSDDDAFTVKDFDDLLEKTYLIAQRTCEKIDNPPPAGIKIDGSWSSWQDWEKCVPDCGGGEQTRRRRCDNPRPISGGRPCPGSRSETRVCNQQPCVGKIHCTERVDLAFLMDGSGSIGVRDFQKERDFVKAMAASFTFARDKTLASVIKYNSKATLEIRLGHHLSVDSFRLRVDQIQYTLGQTRIDKAFDMAAKKIFTTEGGSRPGYPKILVIITDGVQTQDPDTVPLSEAVKPLQRAGVLVIAVGIGGHVDRKELSQMVQHSSDVHTVTDFSDLLKKAYEIAQRTCDSVKGPRVNGGWSVWSNWDHCSATCDGGVQTRKRACERPFPANGGYPCQGSDLERQSCNNRPCIGRIDGRWTVWSHWQRCSATCGGGRQYRARRCSNPAPTNGGRDCYGRSQESRTCSTTQCRGVTRAIDGQWTSWYQWQRCSKSCGGGRQYRRRYCANPRPSNGGRDCVGEPQQSQSCSSSPCFAPIDGRFTQWNEWRSCSRSCGGGIQFRLRYCTNPRPANGGRYCAGNFQETRGCANTPCRVTIDGQWSSWFDWQSCTASCGGGRQQRVRYCSNPRPSNGGRQCVGKEREIRFCALNPCRGRTDGRWTVWSHWQRCSATCGGGRQYRARQCSNPAPTNGGRHCYGRSRESRACSTTPCRVPVRGVNCRNLNGEVIFIMTSSRNVGTTNFQKQRDIVKQMAATFGVSDEGTRVGIIAYGDNAKVYAKFGEHSNLRSFSRAVDGVVYEPGQSRMDKALRIAATRFFPSSGLVSYNVPRLIILLTDDRQTQDYDSIPLSRAVTPLRIAKVKIFAIGVGPRVDPRQLQVLAEESQNAFRVQDFDDLLRRTNEISRRTCSRFFPKPRPRCLGMTDLAFILDSSGSVGAANFEKQRQFVKAMSSSFTVGALSTHVGVITYGNFALVHLRFADFYSINEIRRAVAKIPYTQGQPRLDMAMQLATNDLFTVSGGARWDVPKVVVIVTDGIQSDESVLRQASKTLRRAGIKVLVIGIGGGVDPNKLRELVESGSDTIIVTDFDNLLTRAHEIALRTCSDVRGPFPVVSTLSPGHCLNIMDLGFALDSSSEVTLQNYLKQKKFVQDIAAHIGFSQYGSRMGVLVYGDNSLIEIRLNHHPDAEAFKQQVDKLPYYSQRRRIGKALTTANLLFEFASNGVVRNPKVLVLIATGRRTLTADGVPLWQAAQPLKRAGIRIIAIGIGNDIVLQNQLRFITNRNDVFMIPNFDVLLRQVRNFRKIICDAGARRLG